MATSEEIKVAVDRWRAGYPRTMKGAIQASEDGTTMAYAYVAHVAEQERIAATRVNPVGYEWLKSIGGRESSDSTIAIQFEDTVLVTLWGFEVIVCNARPQITQQGEFLDLLSALKIKVSLDAKD